MSDTVLAPSRAAESSHLEEQHMSGPQSPDQPPGPSQGQAGQVPPAAQPGQYPPAGAGQYPPPGTPPGTPPGPWAYGQPPAGPPPGGSGNNKVLWIILGVIAAFMVLAVLLVVVLVVAANKDDDPVAGTAGGGTSAKSQPAVVKAYLSAVAAGDAEKALSLASVEPLEKDFLTDDVLAESAKIAKITDIKVGDVANEFTSSVPASFKIGDQTVTSDFYVTKSGDDWKMREAGSTLDFTSMRKNTLPMMLNGTAVDVDKVTLFPGAYALTTGTDTISYGTNGQFTVKGSIDYLRGSDLMPTLTREGEQAYVDAVKASTRACLQKKELSPANCPNKAGSSSSYKLDKASIKWAQRGGTDPFANLKPRLDYESPNVAESRPSLQLTVTAGCSSPSGRCSLSTYSFKTAAVDMLKEPLVVRWVD